jgi:hypothetical protein
MKRTRSDIPPLSRLRQSESHGWRLSYHRHMLAESSAFGRSSITRRSCSKMKGGETNQAHAGIGRAVGIVHQQLPPLIQTHKMATMTDCHRHKSCGRTVHGPRTRPQRKLEIIAGQLRLSPPAPPTHHRTPAPHAIRQIALEPTYNTKRPFAYFASPFALGNPRTNLSAPLWARLPDQLPDLSRFQTPRPARILR